ncbi:hypothetical protein Tco_0411115 [Tanacetum coccineum]
MTKLTQKNVKFDWSERLEAHFSVRSRNCLVALDLALPQRKYPVMVMLVQAQGEEERGGSSSRLNLVDEDDDVVILKNSKSEEEDVKADELITLTKQ